jgi:hypothetical protein
MLRPDPLLRKKYAKRKKHSHQLTRTRSMHNSWGELELCGTIPEPSSKTQQTETQTEPNSPKEVAF